MKVIELLNKIAKGEMIGTKFKYSDDYFMVGDSGQINRYTNDSFEEIEYSYDNIGSDYDGLNDEIEIIEEEKEIEEINKSYPIFDFNKESFEAMKEMVQDIYSKQCEIIREVNKIKKEGK